MGHRRQQSRIPYRHMGNVVSRAYREHGFPMRCAPALPPHTLPNPIPKAPSGRAGWPTSAMPCPAGVGPPSPGTPRSAPPPAPRMPTRTPSPASAGRRCPTHPFPFRACWAPNMFARAPRMDGRCASVCRICGAVSVAQFDHQLKRKG